MIDYDYGDADIILERISVRIHQCILGSRTRSMFFHEVFKRDKDKKKGSSKNTCSVVGVIGCLMARLDVKCLSFTYKLVKLKHLIITTLEKIVK